MSSAPNITSRIASAARSRAQLRWVLGVTLAALAILTGLLVDGFLNAADKVDTADRQAQQVRAANYLNGFGDTAARQIRVQIVWDDAFLAIGKAVDPAWADMYVGTFFWNTIPFDESMIVNPQGAVLRHWQDGKPVAQASLSHAPQPWIAALLSQGKPDGAAHSYRRTGRFVWPYNAAGRPLERMASGLVDRRGIPAIASAVAILPDGRFDLLTSEPNYVVTIRHIDSPFLARMGRVLALETPVHAVRPLFGNHNNSLALRDPGGRDIGWLTWRTIPFSESLRAQVKPLFAVYIAFLLAVLGGGVVMVVSLWRSMRDLEASENQAQHVALHDAMTGLPNRENFLATLTHQLALADQAGPEQAGEGRRVYVAYFDLDRFKSVNDTLGHDVGDELVRQAARRLRARLAPDDFVARLGGDEFAVIRTAGIDEAGADNLGWHISSAVQDAFHIFENRLDVTLSCGIAWAPDHGQTCEALQRNADIAMYRAKHDGRDCWRLFSQGMADAELRRRIIEVQLREALEGDSLDVAYQPVLDLESNRFDSVEALLRWVSPTFGSVSPRELVGVAEQTGLMVPLGWWLMRKVFGHCLLWPQVRVSINLSPLQLKEQAFLEGVESLAREFGVDRSRITFEITEDILMVASDDLRELLRSLRRSGFSLALDDFGTGYSSLGYLRNFEFDRIKIDRAFVHGIESNVDAFAVLKAIASLGAAMRMITVAEGVETLLQRDMVVAAGCNMLQGYYYQQPMSSADLEQWLMLRSPEVLSVRAPYDSGDGSDGESQAVA